MDDGLTRSEFGDTAGAALGRRSGPDIESPYDLARAKWMFWVAFAFMGILAIMLPHGGAVKPIQKMPLYHAALPLTLLALWLVIVVEGVAGYLVASDRKPALKRLLLVVFLPPVRMTISPRRSNDWVWLPNYDWLPVTAESVAQMEQRTAVPMLIATALIVPVLIVDFGFPEAVENSPNLEILLIVLMALIWFSFALEFAIMVSLAPKKLKYCQKHWINIVIIILPLIAFLRTLQLFRFLQIAQASKMAKAYRLRGLATRLLKIALAFNLIDRLMALSPDRYCASLEEKITEREDELADLRRRLEMAREKSRDKAAERAAKAQAQAGKTN